MREYIDRSKQKSRKTYLGCRTAVNLFIASCKKTYFDQICRDDMLDFLHELRTRPSRETGKPIGGLIFQVLGTRFLVCASSVV